MADFATKVTKIPANVVQIGVKEKVKYLIFKHLTFKFVGVTG